VAVVTAWVTEDGREEPEQGGREGSYRDAECDEWREEVDYYKHGRAVVLRRVVRVHQVQLQVERWGEECGELRRK
jgi:hypothetical protein